MAKQRLTLPFDGARLRQHRELGGFLQAELAERCAKLGHPVDRSRISQLERLKKGQGPRPSPPLLRALAQALEVKVADLLIPESESTQEPE